MGRLFKRSAAAVAATALLAAMPLAALESPFPGPLAEAYVTADLIDECQAPPDPVMALPSLSRYRQDDPTRSVVDDDQSAAYDAAVKPLRDFQGQVVDWISDFVEKPSKRVDRAACAALWLKTWADKKALVDLPAGQGQFNRDQALAGLSLAWLQLANVSLEDPTIRPSVTAWFRSLAERSRRHYDTEAGRVSRANNHRYFAALGVATTGVIVNDRGLFDWGMATLRTAACGADPDGGLPLELGRGERAREYQIFATGPLVMLAELASRNGVDGYGFCGGAVRKIVSFSLASIDDPSAIERRSSSPQRQKPMKELKGYSVAWLAPYLSRFPDMAWRERAENLSRLKSTSLGGNLETLYLARDWKDQP